MRDEAPVSSRLLLLLVLPSLVVGLLVYIILTADYHDQAARQQRLYGQATADQLSDYLAQYVVSGDMLSLNVVTAGLVNGEQVRFVTVYDEHNVLIAQSGRDPGGTTSFTSEIVFQDSAVGFVRISVPDAGPAGLTWLVIPGLFVLVSLAFVLQSPTLITRWLYAVPETGAGETTAEDPTVNAVTNGDHASADDEECILVIRIRPAHYLERYFDRFFSAAELYSGIVEQTTPEELVIHFEGADAVFMATSAGLLIRELTDLMQGNMSFGGTLDLISEEPEKTRKAASYLASIANGDLLVAGGESLLEERFELQSFHHSLVDSGNLRRIAVPSNPGQLQEQARKLVSG